MVGYSSISATYFTYWMMFEKLCPNAAPMQIITALGRASPVQIILASMLLRVLNTVTA